MKIENFYLAKYHKMWCCFPDYTVYSYYTVNSFIIGMNYQSKKNEEILIFFSLFSSSHQTLCDFFWKFWKSFLVLTHNFPKNLGFGKLFRDVYHGLIRNIYIPLFPILSFQICLPVMAQISVSIYYIIYFSNIIYQT